MVLREPQQAVQLEVLPLPNGSDVASQLVFSLTCGRLLLVAGLTDEEARRNALICWDLASLEVVARLELGDAAAGKARFALRAIGPAGGSALELLTFPDQALPGESKPKTQELKLWRMEQTGDGELEFALRATATFPSSRAVHDAVFLEGGSKLLCWMSDFELLELDLHRVDDSLGASGAAANGGDAILDDLADDGRTKAARIVGGRTTLGNGGALQGYASQGRPWPPPKLRTTAAQQAGVQPRLLKNVIPPNVPSHLLPAPSVLYRSLLDIYAAPYEDDSRAFLESNTASSREAVGADSQEEPQLPPWVPRGTSCQFEVMDADFMEKLFNDAMAAR